MRLILNLIFFDRSNKDKKSSSLSKVWRRILSGIILGIFVVSLIYWHQISCFALICITAVLLSFEYYQLAEKIGTSEELKFIGSGVTFLFCLSAWIGIANMYFMLFLVVLLAILIQIIRQDSTTAILSIATTVFGTIYIGWVFGMHLIRLRQLSQGVYWMFFLLAVIWLGDTGAYTFGKLFGKHKLIPSISPGKTIEGSIGGLLFGMLGGLVVKLLWLDILGWTHFVILTVTLGIVGQIGDLCESLLKRNAGVKDSGNLIPGHGGIFDRCDSLVLATPVLYYYIVYLIA